MSILNLPGIFGNGIIKFAKTHDTQIMTAAVSVGIVATGYLSGKAAIKAYKALEEAEYTSKEPLKIKDKFKVTWKFFIPPFATAAATVVIAIGAESLHLQRRADLIQAYLLADTARKEFEAKTEAIVGKTKTEKIRDEIVHDKVEANPPTDENIFYTTHGDTLFYDEWSGRYFKSSIEFVKDVFNKLNNRINSHETISPNDIYYELDIPQIPLGDDWEFSTEYTGLIDPKFTSGLTRNDIPYVSIGYYNKPAIAYRTKMWA